MTNTYGPEITKLKMVDSIFYYTPNGVWAPGIAFPSGSANPTETSTDHDKDFYYGTSSGHLWQYQGGDYPTGNWVDLGTAANAITWCGTTVPDSGSGNELDLFTRYDSGNPKVGEIYQKIDGTWRNIGSNQTGLPLSTAAINFTDSSKTWRQANLGLLLVSDDGSSPLLATDVGFVVKKDITAGGYVGANQGELWLGHGRNDATDNPKIVLMHSTGSYFAQQHPGEAYDTLYLTMANCSTPAHLDLGNLTAHGDLTLAGSAGSIYLQIDGRLQWGAVSSARLAMVNATRGFQGYMGLATQDGQSNLGIHLMSGLQVDHVDSATGGGIYLFDDLRLWGATAGHKLYDATNDSGSSGEVLTVNASGLPVWSTNTWNGGTVTNNIDIANSKYLRFNSPTDPFCAIDFWNYRSIWGKNTYDIEIDTQSGTGFTPRMLIRGNASQGSAGIHIYEPLSSGQYGVPLVLANGGVGGQLVLKNTNSSYSWNITVGDAGMWSDSVNFVNGGNLILHVNPNEIMFAGTHFSTLHGNALTLSQDTKIEHANIVYFNVNSSNSGTVQVTLQQAGADKLILRHYSGNSYISSAAGALYLAGSTVRSQNDFVAEAGCYINKTNPFLILQHEGSNRIQLGYDGSNCYLTANNGGDFSFVNNNGSITLAASSGKIYTVGGVQLVPNYAGTGAVGNPSGYGDGKYFSHSAAYTVYGHNSGYFDAYDDLALVKQWGEKTPTITSSYNGQIRPEDDDPFSMLRGNASKESEFFDLMSVCSFALGCAKALAKKQDENDRILLEVVNEKERMREEIADLRSQLQKLTAKVGVSA